MNQEIVFFHERARKVFFALFNQFRQAVTALDRQRDENVFQQVRSMYLHQLRQRLQDIAGEVMKPVTSQDAPANLHQAISVTIQEYVHEFEQKAASL